MAFYYPAYSAWLPALVPEEDLLAVNGFEGMVRPTDRPGVGPGVAGVVVGVASPGAALCWSRRISSLAGLVALTAVPWTAVRREPAADDAVPTHPVVSMLRDMGEGFGYMVRTPWLLATLLFASLMVFVIMGPFEVLVPFLIKDKLGGGPGDHAMVMAAFGIGGAIGSLVVASLPMPRRYLTWMNLMWGVGLPAVRGDGRRHRALDAGRRRAGARRALLGPDGHLGHAAPAPGAAAPARPGGVARLLRLDQPDADLDGAGRPGRRGDRSARRRS